MDRVEIIEYGNGVPVVFVHGDVFGAEAAWEAQQTLAGEHRLRLVNRRGFGGSPAVDGEDFAVDAGDVAQALGAGAHLVGHSYGGVVSLLAAAQRPEAVFSLTVVEPPAFGLVREQHEVAAFIDAVEKLLATDPTPEEFLPRFIRAVGGDPGRLPTPLPPALVQAARVQMRGRWPWEADIPLDLLAATPFPKLVVSGGHSQLFDAVCDVLEHRLPATRAVVPGAGHSVPQVGPAFNQHLTKLWEQVDA